MTKYQKNGDNWRLMRKVSIKQSATMVFLLLIASLIILMVTGCFQSHGRLRERYRELRGKDKVTVVFYGEELAGGELYYQTGLGFGDVLGPRLGELLDTRLIWIDSSAYQMTVRKGYQNIQPEVISFLPDAVFVHFGMADAIISGLTLDNFRIEIERLFDEFDSFKVMPVVFTMVGFRDFDPKSDSIYRRVQDLNEIIVWIAGGHQFPLIDIGSYMNTLLLKNPEYYRSLFSDQTHLNEEGMNYLADFVMKEISNAVGDRPAE